jgi:hypothetical protein
LSQTYNYLKQVIKLDNICIACYEIYDCGTTNIHESAKALTQSGKSPAEGSRISLASTPFPQASLCGAANINEAWCPPSDFYVLPHCHCTSEAELHPYRLPISRSFGFSIVKLLLLRIFVSTGNSLPVHSPRSSNPTSIIHLDDMGRPQRKRGRLPPSFYIQQRAEVAAQGKTRKPAADNTEKSLATVLKKWEG